MLDYTKDDYADGSHRYDVVVDIAGNPGLARLRSALTPEGTGRPSSSAARRAKTSPEE